MKLAHKFLIIFLLILGIFIRLIITSNGNFIFHMDNARDMVHIREMVILHKWRLIGPTSGIEGVFTGPLWYYISAVPFIISGGNPQASIYLQIFFWALGGFFLLNLVSRWGIWAIGAIGGVWVASNLVILNSQHSLSPNPILLLMPLFIYLLEKSLRGGRFLINIFCWLMVSLFFQLEMALGIFMPLVMIVAMLSIGGAKKWLHLGLGLGIFVISLMPQIIFDFRHQFLMTTSLLNYFSYSLGKSDSWDLGTRIFGVLKLYWDIYQGLMMNWKPLVVGSLAVLIFAAAILIRRREWFKEKVAFISVLIIFIPLLGYLILPLKVMHWHAQAGVGAVLILFGYGIGKLGRVGIVGVSLVVIFYSVYNLEISYFRNVRGLSQNNNPSILKNEIAAIDYVYQKANGKNFKVYVYMPSIIDYPYQYLFWWYGTKRYGYVPVDYAYLPNMPKYIDSKEVFSNLTGLESSGKIFLIKEPDTRGERHLWENSFKNFPLISITKLGSIDIEERREIYQLNL